MFKKIKFWMVLGLILIPGCLGGGKDKRDVSVITSIDLGTTNTKLFPSDGSSISDYDMRVSVRTREDAGVQVQSVTVTTPSGASLTCGRDDKGAIDLIDPEYGIEVIREFEPEGNKAVWTIAAIANPEYEFFGDGTYMIFVQHKNGSDQIELWYGEPGSENPLPFPKNDGFKEPDVTQPMTSPITFKWDTDPIAQNISVYFAGEGQTKSDQFPASTTSFGPYDYAPGQWELELVLYVERKGNTDGVNFTISKGTVYSTEGVVK